MNLHFRNPEAATLYFRNQPGAARDRLALAEHGYSLRYSNPEEMRAWCDAALVGLSPEFDVQTAALLHGYAGNAHRVVGEFASAEQLLKEALTLSSSAEPLLLEFWASLLNDLSRLSEASRSLAQATALRRRQKDPIGLASILLQSALGLDLTGRSGNAASVAHSAIESLADQPPSEKGAELLRTALQNIALYLTDAGRPQAALLVLRHSRRLLATGGFRFQLRVDWLDAHISSALGHDSGARKAYVAIRERFAAEQMLQEVALVSLDLAQHLLPLSPVEARAEVSSVGPILTQIGIADDAEEFRLLRLILESAKPDLELMSELSRLLCARQRFKKF
jgi:tetratricopeptide (TPR) repeat protein